MRIASSGGRGLHITPREADRRLAAVARRQHGCVTTAQLLAAGLHRNAIATRMRRGLLRRLHYGVYLLGAPNTHTPYLAAVLACGPAALLSHRAAAVVWGIVNDPARSDRRDRHARPPPQPPRHQGPPVAGRAHHPPRDPDHHAAANARGPRKILGADAYERAQNEARVLRLPLPARSSSLAPDLTRSEAEHRLKKLIEAAGLPRPRTNVRYVDTRSTSSGPRPDLSSSSTDGARTRAAPRSSAIGARTPICSSRGTA